MLAPRGAVLSGRLPSRARWSAVFRAAGWTSSRAHGGHGHGHSHDNMDHPGHFSEREHPLWATALTLKLCMALREKYNIGVVTNDIFTREDAEFLTRNGALPSDRIRAVETGGCPHAAIREDVSSNLAACESLTEQHAGVQLVICESGGDNLAANFSRELADYTIYVIDVAGGDKVPRKGGPGITQSDLLIINKVDLAPAVGADLDVMDRDAKKMRGSGPTVFAAVKHGEGVPEIVGHILSAWSMATGGQLAE
ncbi:unnamed protein product [Durusdinium trenchii]|uniref:CobW/HypB/UreG nucleotide-binding domain-containing protein n=1 Tax=Durusdinium trenchii TaxID=1381693 RepID=A0ABP0SMC8_9DINO